MHSTLRTVSPGDLRGFAAARHLPDPADGARSTPAGLVGNTPVLWIGEPFSPGGHGFWAKLEGANPGGLKDRSALHMVAAARRRGELAPGATVVESTSGTLGLGLALAGITFGHPVTLVTDPGLEPLMRHQLAAYGARVEVVRAPHPSGGWQQARRDRSRNCWPRSPAPGARTSTTTPTTPRRTTPSPSNSPSSSAASTSSSPRSAPAATPRASPARCARSRRGCGWSGWTRCAPRSSGSRRASG